jgi:hypothetical protein
MVYLVPHVILKKLNNCSTISMGVYRRPSNENRS